MKTAKDIKIATLDYLKAFEEQKAHELDGTFIPFNSLDLYQQHKFNLRAFLISLALFLYLAYNAWYVDAIYYWHIDFPVVFGILTILFFLFMMFFFLNQYIKTEKVLQATIESPNQTPYGVLITDEYYFENSPDSYHIIPRANIIRVEHEEERNNKELYIEVLVDVNDQLEIRGILYKKSEFDIKTWIENR